MTVGSTPLDATSIRVAEPNKLPPAPNYMVVGRHTVEIIYYPTPAVGGVYSDVTRGVNETTGRTWPDGTPVARRFTAADLDAIQYNILDIDSRVGGAAPTELDDLTDVTINAGTLADGDFLHYDLGTGQWVNAVPPPGPQGEEGPQGPAGQNGAPGAQGPKGDDGAAGPQGEQGIQGIQGEEGPQGIQGDPGTNGTDGADGADGKTVLNGTADPTTEGTLGDFYIQTTSHSIFGPKAGGGWGSGTSLIGPQGDQGAQGEQGIQGIQGIQGEEGPQGDPGATTIAGCTDVVLTNIEDTNILEWDTSTSKWVNVPKPSGEGATDHGALTGLADDDHTQYFNSTRHDTTSAHALGTVVPHDSWTGVTDKPSTFAPSAHASSHATGQGDAIAPADIGAATAGHDHTGVYAPDSEGVTNGDSHDHSGGDGGQIAYSSLGSIPSTFAPAAHATDHKSGGTDHIHLDEFAAPDDSSSTTGDATTGHHGLLPKLGGGTTNFFRADGTWAAPPGGGGALNDLSDVDTTGHQDGWVLTSDGTDFHMEAPAAGNAGVDTWMDVASFTRASDSTFTVTDNAGNQAIFCLGRPLRYRATAGTFRYGIVIGYTTGTVTIAGHPLSTSDDDEMDYGDMSRVVQVPVFIPGFYEDADNTALIASDLGMQILWQQGAAYLVRVRARSRVHDTGASHGTANAYNGANAVLTTPLTLAADATWYDSGVALSATYYAFAMENVIEAGAVKGTNGDGQDLAMLLSFVVA